MKSLFSISLTDSYQGVHPTSAVFSSGTLIKFSSSLKPQVKWNHIWATDRTLTTFPSACVSFPFRLQPLSSLSPRLLVFYHLPSLHEGDPPGHAKTPRGALSEYLTMLSFSRSYRVFEYLLCQKCVFILPISYINCLCFIPEYWNSSLCIPDTVSFLGTVFQSCMFHFGLWPI